VMIAGLRNYSQVSSLSAPEHTHAQQQHAQQHMAPRLKQANIRYGF
jgi:hypothetical protein